VALEKVASNPGRPESQGGSISNNLPEMQTRLNAESEHVAPIEKFSTELHKLGAECILTTPEQLHKAISNKLHDLNLQTVLVWDDLAELGKVNLFPHLRQSGITLVNTRLLLRNPARQEGLQWLGKAQAGITGCLAAFAETGTVVVSSGQDRSQLASLLPRVHLVIVDDSQIQPNYDCWLNGPGKEAILSTQCTTWISGPSRTADIEMTLTIGVHGPEQVIVFVIDHSSVPVAYTRKRARKSTS
jgi:L-lactate dehydrogenase complex protein LldG